MPSRGLTWRRAERDPGRARAMERYELLHPSMTKGKANMVFVRSR